MRSLQSRTRELSRWRDEGYPPINRHDRGQGPKASIGKLPMNVTTKWDGNHYSLILHPTKKYKKVRVRLLNDSGRFIGLLHRGSMKAGEYPFEWTVSTDKAYNYVIHIEVDDHYWMYQFRAGG